MLTQPLVGLRTTCFGYPRLTKDCSPRFEDAMADIAGNEPIPTPGFRSVSQANNPNSPSTASGALTMEDAVRIRCLTNARYHASREAFLDGVHRWFMFGVIALGAGAVVDLFSIALRGIFAAGAATLGALDLTFDLSSRARLHSLMKRRYFELLADLSEGGTSLKEAESLLNRYSADEGPSYQALLAASRDAAQEMVRGDNASRYHIPRIHLWLRNIFRFGGEHYQGTPPQILNLGKRVP
jgi:hypothetical protein